MSFQDIKGQDNAIKLLCDYARSGRLSGSYLFSGEEGIGKKLVARTLAKALNCRQGHEDCCGQCPSCLKIEKGQHPDIHFLEAGASEAIKIEYIRQLQKEVFLRPYEAEKKFFIIDDAHNLTADAANALLKALEEPPQDSIIILVSAKPGLLFKTIISRCKTVRFYPLKRPDLEQLLIKDYSLVKTEAHFLAYLCEGRLGYALRLKDSGALREKNNIIDNFILAQRPGALNPENKNILRNYLNIAATWFRDIYLVKLGVPLAELINLDRKDELARQARRYTLFELDEAMRAISDSFLYLEQNINLKLLLSSLRLSLKA